MSGPSGWSQARFAAQPILGGKRLSAHPEGFAIRPNSGANIIGVASGVSFLQHNFEGDDRSNSPTYFQWSFLAEADDESEWDALEAAVGNVLWFVSYQVVREQWTVAAGANSLTLARPIASAKEPLFEAGAFPNKAYLNGVAQTIVDTGAPSVGEISINPTSGTAVVTPALSAGDVLAIKYYPAFPVSAEPLGQVVQSFNALFAQVNLFEMRRQSP